MAYTLEYRDSSVIRGMMRIFGLLVVWQAFTVHQISAVDHQQMVPDYLAVM